MLFVAVMVGGGVEGIGGGGGGRVRRVMMIWKLLRKALMPRLRSRIRKVCRGSMPPQWKLESAMIPFYLFTLLLDEDEDH